MSARRALREEGSATILDDLERLNRLSDAIDRPRAAGLEHSPLGRRLAANLMHLVAENGRTTRPTAPRR